MLKTCMDCKYFLINKKKSDFAYEGSFFVGMCDNPESTLFQKEVLDNDTCEKYDYRKSLFPKGFFT